MKVVFRTRFPISQECGMEFWAHGSRFASVPGRCTYQLTTSGEALSHSAAVESVSALIKEIVGKHGLEADFTEVLKITWAK